MLTSSCRSLLASGVPEMCLAYLKTLHWWNCTCPRDVVPINNDPYHHYSIFNVILSLLCSSVLLLTLFIANAGSWCSRSYKCQTGICLLSLLFLILSDNYTYFSHVKCILWWSALAMLNKSNQCVTAPWESLCCHIIAKDGSVIVPEPPEAMCLA